MEFAVPYGLYIKRTMEGIHNYSFVNVLQELCDNAFDVKAEPVFKVACHNSNNYLIAHTLGGNIKDLKSYFGLGDVAKKPETSIGQHNCGALKSICWLLPQRVIITSCNKAGDPVSLEFRFSDYINALNTSNSYTDSSILLSTFMVSKEGPDVFTELTPILGLAKDRKLSSEYSSIQKKAPHFAVIFELNDRHRLYGKIDKLLEESLPTLGFTYYSILCYIKKIYVEYSTGKFTVLGRDSGLKDIFMGNMRFDMKVNVTLNEGGNRLQSEISVYGKRDDRIHLVVDDSTQASEQYYGSGSFAVKFTYLNEQEVMEQGNAQDCRGVIYSWNGRRNTVPYWNPAWGPKENGTYMRCELLAEESRTTHTLLGRGDLANAHPIIQKFITMIMVHLAFIPNGDEAKTKPVISSELYKILKEGPNSANQ